MQQLCYYFTKFVHIKVAQSYFKWSFGILWFERGDLNPRNPPPLLPPAYVPEAWKSSYIENIISWCSKASHLWLKNPSKVQTYLYTWFFFNLFVVVVFISPRQVSLSRWLVVMSSLPGALSTRAFKFKTKVCLLLWKPIQVLQI